MPNSGSAADETSHDRNTLAPPRPPAELSVVVVDDPSGAVVVTVSGEIDISNFERFHAAVNSSLAEKSQLRLDLSGVTFIDSAGIDVLVRLAATEADLQLRKPSQPVPGVIELTGLASVLPVVS